MLLESWVPNAEDQRQEQATFSPSRLLRGRCKGNSIFIASWSPELGRPPWSRCFSNLGRLRPRRESLDCFLSKLTRGICHSSAMRSGHSQRGRSVPRNPHKHEASAECLNAVTPRRGRAACLMVGQRGVPCAGARYAAAGRPWRSPHNISRSLWRSCEILCPAAGNRLEEGPASGRWSWQAGRLGGRQGWAWIWRSSSVNFRDTQAWRRWVRKNKSHAHAPAAQHGFAALQILAVMETGRLAILFS